MDGQSQVGCLWAAARDPAYLRTALNNSWSAGGLRGKVQFQGAVYGVSPWQSSPIKCGLQARFVARLAPDFQAQYLKNIRTHGADVSGCAFPACQPPRVVRCAHTSQAGRPAPWGSNSMDVLPDADDHRPGALRLGACPCGQCRTWIGQGGSSPPPVRKSHSRTGMTGDLP